MILGTGLDIAEVSRIRESIERFGDRFLRRIFPTAKSLTANEKPAALKVMPRASPPRKPG